MDVIDRVVIVWENLLLYDCLFVIFSAVVLFDNEILLVSMWLRVVSSEWQLYYGEVDKVFVPTDTWYLCILPNHMNMVSLLVPGDIRYVVSKEPVSALDSFVADKNIISVKSGMVMVEDNSVTITIDELQ